MVAGDRQTRVSALDPDRLGRHYSLIESIDWLLVCRRLEESATKSREIRRKRQLLH